MANQIGHSFLQRALHLIFPRRCLLCHDMLNATPGWDLCHICEQSIEWWSQETPITFTPDGIDNLTCATEYGGAISSLVLSLKFEQADQVATTLATALWQHEATRARLEDCDLIVPIPLHWRRRATRGYDQVLLIANCLPLPIRAKVFPFLIHRSRATIPQTSQNRANRRKNIVGAFSPGSSLTHVRGRKLVLLDDVVSTGATMSACAAVLNQGQPASIAGVAVAATTLQTAFPLASDLQLA